MPVSLSDVISRTPTVAPPPRSGVSMRDVISRSPTVAHRPVSVEPEDVAARARSSAVQRGDYELANQLWEPYAQQPAARSLVERMDPVRDIARLGGVNVPLPEGASATAYAQENVFAPIAHSWLGEWTPQSVMETMPQRDEAGNVVVPGATGDMNPNGLTRALGGASGAFGTLSSFLPGIGLASRVGLLSRARGILPALRNTAVLSGIAGGQAALTALPEGGQSPLRAGATTAGMTLPFAGLPLVRYGAEAAGFGPTVGRLLEGAVAGGGSTGLARAQGEGWPESIGAGLGFGGLTYGMAPRLPIYRPTTPEAPPPEPPPWLRSNREAAVDMGDLSRPSEMELAPNTDAHGLPLDRTRFTIPEGEMLDMGDIGTTPNRLPPNTGEAPRPTRFNRDSLNLHYEGEPALAPDPFGDLAPEVNLRPAESRAPTPPPPMFVPGLTETPTPESLPLPDRAGMAPLPNTSPIPEAPPAEAPMTTRARAREVETPPTPPGTVRQPGQPFSREELTGMTRGGSRTEIVGIADMLGIDNPQGRAVPDLIERILQAQEGMRARNPQPPIPQPLGQRPAAEQASPQSTRAANLLQQGGEAIRAKETPRVRWNQNPRRGALRIRRGGRQEEPRSGFMTIDLGDISRPPVAVPTPSTPLTSALLNKAAPGEGRLRNALSQRFDSIAAQALTDQVVMREQGMGFAHELSSRLGDNVAARAEITHFLMGRRPLEIALENIRRMGGRVEASDLRRLEDIYRHMGEANETVEMIQLRERYGQPQVLRRMGKSTPEELNQQAQRYLAQFEDFSQPAPDGTHRPLSPETLKRVTDPEVRRALASRNYENYVADMMDAQMSKPGLRRRLRQRFELGGERARRLAREMDLRSWTEEQVNTLWNTDAVNLLAMGSEQMSRLFRLGRMLEQVEGSRDLSRWVPDSQKEPTGFVFPRIFDKPNIITQREGEMGRGSPRQLIAHIQEAEAARLEAILADSRLTPEGRLSEFRRQWSSLSRNPEAIIWEPIKYARSHDGYRPLRTPGGLQGQRSIRRGILEMTQPRGRLAMAHPVAERFEDITVTNNAVVRLYENLLNQWSANLTYRYPATHFKNFFTGNILGVHWANGGHNPLDPRTWIGLRRAYRGLNGAVKALRNGTIRELAAASPEGMTPAQRDARMVAQLFLEGGLEHGNFISAHWHEAKNLLEMRAADANNLDAAAGHVARILATAGSAMRKAGNLGRGSYILEDELPRIAHMLSRLDARVPVSEAVRETRLLYPDYSNSPRALKLFSRYGGRFLSWQYQAARVISNAFARSGAALHARDFTPRTHAPALRWFAAATILQQLSTAGYRWGITDMTPEEERRIHESIPGAEIIIGTADNYRVIRLSSFVPGMNALEVDRSRSLGANLANMATANPLRAIWEVATNHTLWGGNEVYNPEAPTTMQNVQSAQFLLGNWLPPWMGARGRDFLRSIRSGVRPETRQNPRGVALRELSPTGPDESRPYSTQYELLRLITGFDWQPQAEANTADRENWRLYEQQQNLRRLGRSQARSEARGIGRPIGDVPLNELLRRRFESGQRP